MTDETTHLATAVASLDDPYTALSQHLHGDGDTAWRTRALAAEAEVGRLRALLRESREWNWLDADGYTDEDWSCLPTMKALNDDIDAALFKGGHDGR